MQSVNSNSFNNTLELTGNCMTSIKLLKQQVIKTFGYISSGPITPNKAGDYNQKVKELLSNINASYETIENQAKRFPDTGTRKNFPERLVTFAGQAAIDKEISDIYDSLIDSSNWSMLQSTYISYLSEFMKSHYSFKRNQMSDFIERPMPNTSWTLLRNPHKMFEDNFAKMPMLPELKNIIQCHYIERSLLSCSIEVKFGHYPDKNKHQYFICGIKVLLVVHNGNIDHVIVAGPDEEWKYQETNKSLLDLSFTSKRRCFRSLTTQANLILANLQPYLSGSQAVSTMKQILSLLSKFQRIYEQPCATCGKVMFNYMPPTVFDFGNPKNVYHEGCKN
uniref:Mediator of RNA polymerase II transcription subunit 27 n=1 Tax=Parastrongyloides trichosuri TaxID=131310 RepID=A0A0N4ZKQ9_PARTI